MKNTVSVKNKKELERAKCRLEAFVPYNRKDARESRDLIREYEEGGVERVIAVVPYLLEQGRLMKTACVIQKIFQIEKMIG